MRTFTATGVVSADHVLTITVPPDVPPGPHTVAVVLEEPSVATSAGIDLHLEPHPVGLVDPNCSFRREDMYGDDGR
jgi:hypothetical protein